MRSIKETVIEHVTMKIVQGDITECTVDAIVNAANSYLQHGGGVAGAIVKKGGSIIQEESNAIGYVPVGECAVTTGGRLKAPYVIHAVGPRFGEGDEENKLKKTVNNVLKCATEMRFQSIAMPAISAGIFGFPKDKCARILVEETATSYSIITITLHAVADGNYDTESIPAEEFEERQTAARSATQTSGPPVPPSSSVPYVPPVVPVIPYLPPAPPIPITPTPVVPTLPKLVLPGVTPSAETQTIAQYDLMAAYEAGLVSITLTGLENGAKLQVTVDRLVDAPMIVVIAPGELVFDLGMAKIAFAAETTIKLDLSTNNSGSFTTKQTGKNRITSGSATTKKARTS